MSIQRKMKTQKKEKETEMTLKRRKIKRGGNGIEEERKR